MKRFKRQGKVLTEFRGKETQKRLAKDLKLNKNFLSNIERGRAGVPVKLAKKLVKRGMSPEILVQAILEDLADYLVEELK
jgi:transcriptional regulator with XRE-family HTH domain